MLYARMILVLLSVNTILATNYLTIQESVLAPTIHVEIRSLVVGEWYRLNWTDNDLGYFFQFNPEGDGAQYIELTLENKYDRKSFTFYLWYDIANELLTTQTLFWGENGGGNGGFQLPNVIGWIMGIPLEWVAILIVGLIGWKIFSFIFRRGR